MRNKISFLLLVSLILAACSSVEYATYRPNGSNGPLWRVKVQNGEEFAKPVFKVMINDSTVVDVAATGRTGQFDADAKYRGHLVTIVVRHTVEMQDLGYAVRADIAPYYATVTIDNKLVGRWRF